MTSLKNITKSYQPQTYERLYSLFKTPFKIIEIHISTIDFNIHSTLVSDVLRLSKESVGQGEINRLFYFSHRAKICVTVSL